jgi:hypothetical protein
LEAFEKFKTRSGPYLALGLSINVKKRNENLAGLSLLAALLRARLYRIIKYKLTT